MSEPASFAGSLERLITSLEKSSTTAFVVKNEETEYVFEGSINTHTA